MNRLAAVRTIAWLRREPFPISNVGVPREPDGSGGEFQPKQTSGEQVPRTERRSLRRSITYAKPATRAKSRPLKMDIHVPVADGPFPLVIYLPGGGFAAAPRQTARATRLRSRCRLCGGLRQVSDCQGWRDVPRRSRGRLRRHRLPGRERSPLQDRYRRCGALGRVSGGYLAALAATTCTPVAPVKAVLTIVGGPTSARSATASTTKPPMPGSARSHRWSATSAIQRRQRPIRPHRLGLPPRPSS